MSNRSKKTVWIDLDNSPHVLFFNPIIKELKKRGIRVIVTARNYAQVISLANLFKLDFKVIGKHHGKNPLLKLIGLFIRAFRLIPTIIKEKPHLALSHGSRSQTIAAKLTHVKAAVAFDYEHSKHLPFFAPDYAIIPEMIDDDIANKWVKNVIKYPGIKENVYFTDFSPDASILEELGLREEDIIVTIRPPATAAHYHVIKSDELFDEVINYLAEINGTKIIILPRTTEQSKLIKEKWNKYFDENKLIIPPETVNGLNLIWHSDLVISGGGTMIREAAALNVPAYSVFAGKVGAVDKYLESKKKMTLVHNIEDIRENIKLIKRPKPDKPIFEKTDTLEYLVEKIENIINS